MQSHRKRSRYLTSTTPTALTMSHFIPNTTNTTLNITNNNNNSPANPNPNPNDNNLGHNNNNNNNSNHNNVIPYDNVVVPTTRHSGSSSSTGSTTTTQACAACKYQRRKCQPDCLLAPYFPYDCTRQFQNAHKLFGVSNITKIIKNLSPHEKDEAMRSIIIQSDIRACDPVGGCYRIIKEYQRQIELYQAELNLVLQQISICRAQAAQQQQQQQQFHIPHAAGSDSSLGCVDNINADPLITYNQLQTSYNNCFNNVGNNQEGYGLIQGDQNQLQDYSSWTVPDVVPTTLLEITDDQHKNLQNERSEDVILESHKALLKEEESTGQEVQDNDLKGAATLFTLTNTS